MKKRVVSQEKNTGNDHVVHPIRDDILFPRLGEAVVVLDGAVPNVMSQEAGRSWNDGQTACTG